MATIDRIRCEWTGGVGLPGVSTFYALPAATGAVASLSTFFEAVKAYMPTGVSVTIPNAGDSIESTTGDLIGGWTSTGGTTKIGTSAQEYAAGVGCRVVWTSTTISRGRRVRGATFLAPLTRSMMDANGTIASAAWGNISAAANVLAGASAIIIHTRPTSPGAADGGYASVSGWQLPDRVTSLRSRRY